MLEPSEDSSLTPVSERLQGTMGGDATGSICLIFPGDMQPPAGSVVLVKGEVQWVADKGSIALFVDEAFCSLTEPGPERIPQQLLFCRSAPVTQVAILMLGGDDPEAYRVLVRKNKDGGSELPCAQPSGKEGLRETALRIMSSTCPSLLKEARLTSLEGVVLDLGPDDLSQGSHKAPHVPVATGSSVKVT